MSALELNDPLQRATRDGNWIYWKGVYSLGEFVTDDCYLDDGRNSVRLGSADEGLEALLARMPEAEAALDAMREGIR